MTESGFVMFGIAMKDSSFWHDVEYYGVPLALGWIFILAIGVLYAGIGYLGVKKAIGFIRSGRNPLRKLQIVLIILLLGLIFFGNVQNGPDSLIVWIGILMLGVVVWGCVSGISWLIRRAHRN